MSTRARFGRLRARRVLLIGVLAIGITPQLRGQDSNALSVEATLGGSYGLGGGPYDFRAGTAVDLSVAFRFHQPQAMGLVVALARGWQGAGPHDSICRPDPTGDCMPDFPGFSSVAMLAGLEAGRLHAGNARLLVGPGYYRTPGARVFGGQGRAEFATPAAGHVALVGFARSDLLPRVAGHTLGLWAAGIGIRLE